MTPVDLLAWSGAAVAAAAAVVIVLLIVIVIVSGIAGIVAGVAKKIRERRDLKAFNRHAQEAMKTVK